MNSNWKSRLPMVLAAALFAAALIVMARSQPAQAERLAEPASGPRYTVIETQGFNLLVTDNLAGRLYYYATDKDVEVGAPLKLRASLDLSQVGEKEIAIKKHNLENIRKKDQK